MRRERKQSVQRTLMVLGLVLGSAVALYGITVVALGVGQPLMLVVSDSMSPTIVAGDVVAIRSASQIHVGDVVVYQKTGTPFRILHRVVCIATSTNSSCVPGNYSYPNCADPLCFYTKGDNNPAEDPLIVFPGEIQGLWIGFKVPFIGMAILCLEQNPTCGGPWGVVSVISLGGVVASDVTVEYLVSKKSLKQTNRDNLADGSLGKDD